MHDMCMATKTISLELDAYEKLKRAKRSPRESFSSVVRRALWPDSEHSASVVLGLMNERMAGRGDLPAEEILDELDRIQDSPSISDSARARKATSPRALTL